MNNVIKRKTKKVMFILLMIFIPSISIGYSALLTTLNINGDFAISGFPTLYNVLANEAIIGTYAKEYTGSHQDSMSGVGTEKIYHWYGSNNTNGTAITNKNNVIFGGFCWQMIRTTDTGGVKLIYNGEPFNGQCLSTRSDHKGTVGTTGTTKTLNGAYIYSDTYEYDTTNNTFTLKGNLTTMTWSDLTYRSLLGKYTCASSSSTCTTIYQVNGYENSTTARTESYTVGNTHYSQIGTSPFNANYRSPAMVGYMYNDVYNSDFKESSSETMLLYYSLSTNYTSYWYSHNVVWGSPTANKYNLDNPYQISSSADYQNLVGEYSFMNSSQTYASSFVHYITAVDDRLIYFIDLTNSGNHTLSDFNHTYTYGDSYTDNGNGTYTINNPTTINRTDWYTGYSNVGAGKYVCKNAVNNTCSELWYTTATYASTMRYIKVANIKYAKSFSWDGNKYILDNATSVSFWDITDSTNKTSLNNAHYTCWNATGECTTISYIHFMNGTILDYINITGGKSVEDALDEMLTSNNVNNYNSTIKGNSDAWYEKYMIPYDSYLEDVIYCNGRTISALGPWNPDGGNLTRVLQFREASPTNDLSCTNVTDRFSVSNNNAKLKYKVGLITSPEMNLLNNSVIRTTGQNYWLSSANYFFSSNPHVRDVSSSGALSSDMVYRPLGVRPAISLKPGTEYTSGDGSMANPYIVDAAPQNLIKLDANGGNWTTATCPSPNSVIGNYCGLPLSMGGNYGILPTPTKANYRFVGWYTAPTGGTQVQNNSTIANETLYAHWEKLDFAITFIGNGNTGGTMDPVTFTNVTSVTLPTNKFTKTDYGFLGWATSANGAVVYRNKQSITVTSDLTLYAKWGQQVTDFSCTGSSQTFTPTYTGYYFVTLDGAGGGFGLKNGATTNSPGNGGHVTGYVYMTQGTPYYVYVGCQGGDGNKTTHAGGTGGYNGGGTGGNDNNGDDDAGGGGGGATDLRTVSGTWNNSDSLNSRIMVAGGGGGSAYYEYGVSGCIYQGDVNGYQLGIGASGANTYNAGPGGGGGGYYGGATTAKSGYNGYGGTCFYGTSVINGQMNSYGSAADGSANIKFVGDEDIADSKINFAYTGSVQTFTAPNDGYYEIRLNGGGGGQGRHNNSLTHPAGYGGYATGVLYMDQGDTYYLYVGGIGETVPDGSKTGGSGGWNGGGKGGNDNGGSDDATDAGGGGGGATDIRTVNGDWDNSTSLNSRILIAAGGGGSTYSNDGQHGCQYEGSTNGYQLGIGQAGFKSTGGSGGGGGGYYGGASVQSNAGIGYGGTCYISNDFETGSYEIGLNLSYGSASIRYIEQSKLYNVLKEEAENGTYALEYVGSHQDTMAGVGTEKIYYWYADNDTNRNTIRNNKNNVVFGGFCWQMIRTTDTGGVKLIYNGVSKYGKCLNSVGGGVETQIRNAGSLSTLIVGDTYDYDISNNTFTLVGNLTTVTWSESTYKNTLGKYTCGNTNTTCTTIFQINGYKDAYSAYTTSYLITPYSSSVFVDAIGTSPYSTSDGEGYYRSPASVGYMYNDVYSYKSTTLSGTVIFGNGVSWNGTKYTLQNTVSLSTFDSSVDETLSTHHYFCSDGTSQCTKVLYAYYKNGTTVEYIELENGVDIERALELMLSDTNVNQYNSAIKGFIEAWYRKNMLPYDSYIEDEIYCNDRSIIDLGGWNPDGGSLTTSLYFKVYNVTTDLSCTNITDRFSVSNTSAPLTYKVGLLTGQELYLLNNSLGNNYANSDYWLGSPIYFSSGTYVSIGTQSNYLSAAYSYKPLIVRPTITLKPNTMYSSGDGSRDNPYMVYVLD